MKITEIRVIVTNPKQNFVFVKVMTDEPGLYGVGDASLNGRELAVKTVIEQYLAPQLIGKDVDLSEDTWYQLYMGGFWRGGPITMAAISGIDIALWDIRAKRAGLPLYSLLGGKVREKVPYYAHVFGRDNAELCENAIRMKEEGIRFIRLRCGTPAAAGTASPVSNPNHPMVTPWQRLPYFDFIVEPFAAVREAVGRETELLYDMHFHLTPREAGEVLRDLEACRPFYIEDPIAPEFFAYMRVVREKTSVPIAFGELFNSIWECIPYFTEHLIDFVRCDLAHIGGVTAGRKIATIAEPFQIRTAWHGPADVSPVLQAVNWHLNIATINFGIQEMGNQYPETLEVCSGGPTGKDGYLVMPENFIGIGTDIDEAAAARYPYQRRFIPFCRDNLGAMTCW